MFSQKIPRRSLLKGGVGALAGLTFGGFLTACQSALTGSPGASGDLIIGFDGGSFQDYLDQAVTRPFVTKYGTHVLYDSAAEPDRLAKAIATKGRRLDDIQELDSKDIQKAISAGVADKLDKSVVTNWQDIAPKFRNDYWASIITYYFGIVYNKEKIPEGITS
jgi:spermidine/putrescine-binding protein